MIKSRLFGVICAGPPRPPLPRGGEPDRAAPLLHRAGPDGNTNSFYRDWQSPFGAATRAVVNTYRIKDRPLLSRSQFSTIVPRIIISSWWFIVHDNFLLFVNHRLLINSRLPWFIRSDKTGTDTFIAGSRTPCFVSEPRLGPHRAALPREVWLQQ